MPMDGLTLGFIAHELGAMLISGRIDKVNQPERDELIITIRNNNANHQLLLSASANHARVHLTAHKKTNPLEPPMFCMLLRKHLTGGRATAVRQVSGDRILEMDIDCKDELGDRTTRTLVIELMGKHSNIMLLRQDGRLIDSARHVTDDISRVREVLPGLPYTRPPGQDKIPFDQVTPPALYEKLCQSSGPLHKALAGCITGLSALSAKELACRATSDEDAHLSSCDLHAVSGSVSEALGRLPAEAEAAILLSDDGAPVDFVAFPYRCRAALQRECHPSLSDAMDAFYDSRDRADRIAQKSSSLHRVLKNNIERCEKKLALQMDALTDAGRMDEYRVMGELITASQHRVQKGMKRVALPNYYAEDMAEIVVPLDEKLSPQQNAQRYFKHYQKARNAQRLAAEQKAKTEDELVYLEGQLHNLEKCTAEAELNEIRQELEKEGYVRANHNRRQMKALPPSQPLHFQSASGLHILVGKNNLQNDKLTSDAQGNETWLHAKDMPGSHVIIASPEVDEETLMQAARIAAHYSKGREGSRVPVDYTLKKYVKKPSGAKPGFVIYTHQKTLYVEPRPE